MNVLMVSLDTTFLEPAGTTRSDTIARHVEIARMLSHLHVIVFCVGRGAPAAVRVTDRLTLHPTQSLNKAMRVFDALRIAAGICRRESIDVATTQDAFFTGMVGWTIRALYGIPLNVQVHADCIGNRFWIRERVLNRFLNVTGRAVVRAADNVRVVGESEKEKMARLGIRESRIWNIPGGGGIDVEKFSRADGERVRRELLPPGCNRIVLFAGRITKQKRIEDLLRAAAKVVKEMPGVVFVVAGEGNQLAGARRLCRTLGLDEKVKFTGNVRYDEMPGYFAAADVFVLPSAYEGTARVLMESVAAGLPIVTTRVSGVSELVMEGENGHIVPVGSPKEMAEQLGEVLRNIEHYRRGAARRREVLERYERRKNLPRLVEMWGQIAGKSG